MKKNLRYIILGVLLIAILTVAVIKFSDKSIKGAIDFTDTFQRENVVAATVEAPEEVKDNGVIDDAEWEKLYPDVYKSYMANEDNSYTVEYLDEDPGLKEIYEGFGFAKSYLEARGHNYTLEDVSETARPHPKANCLTCKTADFTALVNNIGASAYSQDFEEVVQQCSINVGCYNCHENQAGEAGKLVVTHDYFINTLGSEMNNIDPDTLACGQCHIEYYFRPDDKGTEIPYSKVAEMGPTEILAYYDKIGFSDYVQESTGTGMLKAQHPEMETVLGEGNKHTSAGITCADCHMATQEGEDGKLFVSHKLVSPVDDSKEAEAIRANVCAQCHTENMQAKVEDIQATVTAREKAVLASLVELKAKIASAMKTNKYSEDELNAIRNAYRAGEWFFDFCYVENSEGAHNSQLSKECLAKAEAYIAQANAMFK